MGDVICLKCGHFHPTPDTKERNKQMNDCTPEWHISPSGIQYGWCTEHQHALTAPIQLEEKK